MEKLKAKFHKFLILTEKNLYSKPWLVVILMHEYYRNLYPSDLYLSFDKRVSNIKRISLVLDRNIKILQDSDYLGSYFLKTTSLKNLVADKLAVYRSKTKGKTQKVYDRLWKRFDFKNYLEEPKKIIIDRFKNSKFDFKKLKGKTILDLGCGSGRYTIALSLLTKAKKVYGVDLDRESIKRGEKIIKKAKVKNTELKVANVLKLPFRDNFFDFVFCNGVLHHTTNMEKGLRELYRVLKPKCQAYLYLYADGGLFWYSRKKVPKIMKKIPQEYTMAILELIGMPKNRFVFIDNWYVPIERHTPRRYLEDYLKEIGFSTIRKFASGRSTDLDNIITSADPDAKIIWGEGEHRYFITKK